MYSNFIWTNLEKGEDIVWALYGIGDGCKYAQYPTDQIFRGQIKLSWGGI